MTEAEKQQVLANLETRAYIAERNHLHHTAKSWRDYALSLAASPAQEVILANKSLAMNDESRDRAPPS